MGGNRKIHGRSEMCIVWKIIARPGMKISIKNNIGLLWLVRKKHGRSKIIGTDRLLTRRSVCIPLSPLVWYHRSRLVNVGNASISRITKLFAGHIQKSFPAINSKLTFNILFIFDVSLKICLWPVGTSRIRHFAAKSSDCRPRRRFRRPHYALPETFNVGAGDELMVAPEANVGAGEWTRGRSRPLPGLEALWELIQSQTVKEGAPAILLRSDGWFAISLRKRLIYRRIGSDSPGANSSARKRPQFRVSKHRQSVCSIRHLSFISSHHSNALCPIGVAIRLRSKSRDGHPSPGIHGFL